MAVSHAVVSHVAASLTLTLTLSLTLTLTWETATWETATWEATILYSVYDYASTKLQMHDKSYVSCTIVCRKRKINRSRSCWNYSREETIVILNHSVKHSLTRIRKESLSDIFRSTVYARKFMRSNTKLSFSVVKYVSITYVDVEVVDIVFYYLGLL